MNDNNSVGGEGKESQSDNLWPFVGHFLKDHHNSTTILKAAALAKVLMLSCTNFPEKNPLTCFQFSTMKWPLFYFRTFRRFARLFRVPVLLVVDVVRRFGLIGALGLLFPKLKLDGRFSEMGGLFDMTSKAAFINSLL